jgi:hypothetical protein
MPGEDGAETICRQEAFWFLKELSSGPLRYVVPE